MGGVNDPAKDKLASGPCAITFAELLLRSRLLPLRAVSSLKGAEDLIERVVDATAMVGVALDNGDKVVHIHVGIGHGFTGMERTQGAVAAWNRHRYGSHCRALRGKSKWGQGNQCLRD